VADKAACDAVTGAALADAVACQAKLTADTDDAAATKACTYAAAVNIPVVARTGSADILLYYSPWVTEPNHPTSWAGDVNDTFNSESTNALEFGDIVGGYNADTEKDAWEAAGVT
jgi:hypothetical protein